MFRGEKFQKVIYVSGVATGGSGQSYASPKPFVDGDLWAIPQDCIIEKMYCVIDEAITGTTAIDIGDDDDADGFVDGSNTGSINAGLATPGMYGYHAAAAGAYLKTTGADASDTVPNAKYYAAAGKEVKLDVTTANTAGKMRVIIEGSFLKKV